MKIPTLLAALFLLSACTQTMMETSRRELQMTECNRIADAAERVRCNNLAEHGYGTTGGTEQRIPPPSR